MTTGDYEHACIRCPMLNLDPKMLSRLEEIETDHLLARKARAETEGWIGEIEGIDLTLTFLTSKREQANRIRRTEPVNLDISAVRPARREQV